MNRQKFIPGSMQPYIQDYDIIHTFNTDGTTMQYEMEIIFKPNVKLQNVQCYSDTSTPSLQNIIDLVMYSSPGQEPNKIIPLGVGQVSIYNNAIGQNFTINSCEFNTLGEIPLNVMSQYQTIAMPAASKKPKQIVYKPVPSSFFKKLWNWIRRIIFGSKRNK